MIVGISGKKQSGKNTIAKIWQLLDSYHNKLDTKENILNQTDNEFIIYGLSKDLSKFNIITDWKQKSFAYKLKQIVCLLIDCTMEDLENEEFKNKLLGEEWIYWSVNSYWFNDQYQCQTVNNIFITEEKANKFFSIYGYDDCCNKPEIRQLTPRLLLQLLGTECGKYIIHPNIWINSLFKEYKEKSYTTSDGIRDKEVVTRYLYPDWLVTDVRFKDEAESIKDRKGILIRVNRNICKEVYKEDIHESEIALDTYDKFDYTINNDGTLEDLIMQVKEIMIKERVIKV